MSDNSMFEEEIFPINPGEKHLACVLLVDTSYSMSGSPMTELNKALRDFGNELQKDLQTKGCVDVCVLSFNDTVQEIVAFCPATQYTAPELKANGTTSMNEAIIKGLSLLEKRKELYKHLGVPYYRPWLFLMTDGYATDNVYANDAKSRLQTAISSKKVTFFPMAIGESADESTLKTYNNNGLLLKANKTDFAKAFVWLSHSMSVVSRSSDTSKLALPPLPTQIEIEL